MSKKQTMTRDQAQRKLEKAVQAMVSARTTFTEKHEIYADAQVEMVAAQNELGRRAKQVAKLRAFLDGSGPEKQRIEESSEVDVPRQTEAEFLYEIEQAMAGAKADGVTFSTEPKVEKTRAGKRRAIRDMLLYIGGFAYFRNRTEAEEITAARFLNAWDGSQIGGARATDYEQPLVDTSGKGQEGIMVAMQDHMETYRRAVKFLGINRSSILERIIIHRHTCNQIASERAGQAVTGRPVAEVASEFRSALNDLREFWFGIGEGAREKVREWNDGTERHWSGPVLKHPGMADAE